MTYRDQLAAEWPELAHVLATDARTLEATDAAHETAAGDARRELAARIDAVRIANGWAR